jgi:hypothetical protein
MRLDWNRRVITQPSFELDGIALAARRAGQEKQTNASAERRPMPGEGGMTAASFRTGITIATASAELFGLWTDDRKNLTDRWEPSIELHKE